MKARIIILPDGRISAYIDEGTFDEGSAKLAKLLADLGALGIPLTDIGEPEQHKHDQQPARINLTNTAS